MIDYKEIVITPILESIQLLDISDDEYFSEKYKHYISNSSLKLINPEEGGSEELYTKGLSFSPNDSYVFGSAAHQLILQPEEFELAEGVNRPTAKAGFMADELYESWKKVKTVGYEELIKASNKIGYYKNKLTDVKINTLLEKCIPYFEQRYNYKASKTPIYLDEKNRNKLICCLNNVNLYSPIQKLLNPMGLFDKVPSYNEATILLDLKCQTPDNKEFIISMKGKLDNYTVQHEIGEITLNDLKTTGHIIQEFESASFYKYHYYRQMAVYLWLLFLLNQTKYNLCNVKYNANMLLVSTVPPFECGVYQVNAKQILRGMIEFQDLIKRIAFLKYKNEFIAS